jgi:hypothetical protein
MLPRFMSLNSGKLVQESRALIHPQWISRTFRDTTRGLLKHFLSIFISFQQFLLLSRLSHLAYLIIYWSVRSRIVAIRCRLATSVSQLWEGYLRPRTLVTSLNNMHKKYLGTLGFRCLCPETVSTNLLNTNVAGVAVKDLLFVDRTPFQDLNFVAFKGDLSQLGSMRVVATSPQSVTLELLISSSLDSWFGNDTTTFSLCS